MYFYIINLFLIIIFMCILRKHPKIMWPSCFFWLFLLGSFRAEGIGADYYSYEQAYFLFLNGHTTSYEWLYVMLNLMCSRIGGYRIVVASVCFLSLIGPIYYMANNTKNALASMWLYITMGFYLWTYIIYRQAIAISFLLFAYEAAKKRKPLMFISFVLVAYSFHKIAILSIVIYPILNIRIIRKKLVYICTITILVALALKEYSMLILNEIKYLFGERFSYYEIEGIQDGGSSLAIVYFCIFLFILILISFQQKENKLKNADILIFSLFMSICQIIATVFPLANRFGLFFAIPTFILLPNMIEENFRLKSRIACYYVLIPLSFIFFIFSLQSPIGNLVPYRLISF